MNTNPFQPPLDSSEAGSASDSQGSTPAHDPELWEIKQQANNSMVMGIAGFVVCLPMFAGPVAIYCGNRALRMINELNKGHEFERKAKRGVQLGYVALTIFAVSMFVVIVVGIASLFLA